MAPKRNVKFIQPEVPSFLKKFKERVGYKEPAGINDKFSDDVESSEGKNTPENEDREVEEEQPVVVVLKEGDMTAEEVNKYEKENTSTDCWDTESDKPVFKKPVKRSSTEKEVKRGKKKMKSDVKAVKNSKLLSFDEDEEEES